MTEVETYDTLHEVLRNGLEDEVFTLTCATLVAAEMEELGNITMLAQQDTARRG